MSLLFNSVVSFAVYDEVQEKIDRVDSKMTLIGKIEIGSENWRPSNRSERFEAFKIAIEKIMFDVGEQVDEIAQRMADGEVVEAN